MNNNGTQGIDQPNAQQQVLSSVAENVSSFISGIRASFRSDNVIVVSKHQSKKSSEVATCLEKN